jgi:hypothetical protein
MEKLKKESLVKAMSFCGLREIPEEWDKENIYLRALALVSKTDGSESYVLVEKDERGEDRMIKDFGTISAIHETISVHPFFFLDTRWIPEFKPKGKGKANADGKAERIAWLERNNVIVDAKTDIKTLDKEILYVAMQKVLAQHPLV